MARKSVVFSTFGSRGDLYPYMAIAAAMQKRGHDVAIASAEYHRQIIEQSGIRFYSSAPDCDFTNPDFQKRAFMPRTGGRFVLRDSLFPQIRESYADLLRATAGADLLVTQMLSFAGPLVAEKTGIPWVSTVLAPLSFFSYLDSPVLAPQLRCLREWLRSLNCAVNRAARFTTRSWSAAVRDFRRELGLSPGADPIYEGQHSPGRVLALFSAIFAQPQLDWPPNVFVTGFPFRDEVTPTATEAALDEFLHAGPAPLVFTLGTSAVLDPGSFYDESLKAARRLRLRAIVLGARPGIFIVPGHDCLSLPYAPHDVVFRAACVIVHSGGIGTTARALRAGRPSLVVPWGCDQPDNAARLVRMGTARTLSRNAYTARRAARELDRLLNDPKYRRTCERIAGQIQSEDGVKAASAALEACLLEGRSMAISNG
jgi:rhamnosyltransferase subunit B